MKNIVCKFGGTSLADAAQFRKVEAIIKSDDRRCYIIPSAPGKRYDDDIKVTDMLYKCQATAGSDEYKTVFDAVKERYNDIIADLGIDLDLSSEFQTINDKIINGCSKDYAASRGEYLNGMIMAKLLNFPFVDPVDLIQFKDDGNYDHDITLDKVGWKLAEFKKAVIPGFYGANADGEIVTFSRGGSDITGAIIARGVEAYLYENWKDVSGFLTADPRIIKSPIVIDNISYRELRELTYMGANVLHEDAIFPVRETGIPLHIKNTNDPESPGTRIVRDEDKPEHTGAVTGIAGKRDFMVIAIYKIMMNSELGFVRKLLSIMEQYNVSFEHMPSGIDSVSLVIAKNELEGKLDDVLSSIRKELKPDTLMVYHDMALVATVGKGMAHTSGMAAKLLTALADDGINIRMIDQGSSEINIIVGVENGDFFEAIKVIYETFFM